LGIIEHHKRHFQNCSSLSRQNATTSEKSKVRTLRVIVWPLHLGCVKSRLRFMSNLAVTLLIAAVIFLAASFIGGRSEVVDGLGKAMFGVCLSLFFIVLFFGERKA
jgi:lipopolysaccharide export LptBFGC system permease protein LptF